MGYDEISNAYVCAFAKVSSEKKRGNQLAKLKQNKLDCNREQCYIKDNKMEYKMVTNNKGGTPPHSISNVSKGRQMERHLPRMARDVHEVLPIHNNEAITWKSSSINRKSGCANMGNDFHRIKGRSSISGSCSSSCSEDDGEKGCLDDWEAVADALNADSGTQVSVLEPHDEDGSQYVNKSRQQQGNSRAWTPDDVFRPQSLPRVSRLQNNLTQNTRHDNSSSPAIFSWQRVTPPEQQPSTCPICCEDLDGTDSNFLPCPCGFRLCLFCHKRILEVDGRCPGCRKHYDSANASAGLPGAPLGSQLT